MTIKLTPMGMSNDVADVTLLAIYGTGGSNAPFKYTIRASFDLVYKVTFRTGACNTSVLAKYVIRLAGWKY
jgi:hypothetical protein